MELFRFSDGHAIHRSVAWVVARRVSGPSRLEDIEVLIEPPPEGTPHLFVDDIKGWFLSGKPERRRVPGRTRQDTQGVREATPDAVFEGYVEAVLRKSGLSGERTLWLLMPAVPDPLFLRYRDLMRRVTHKVLPRAAINLVPEPEMVLEYFRLVRNDVTLERRTSFFLVVDSGASTTNFTVVVTTKKGTTSTAAERRRPTRLRSISSSAAQIGGHAVDTQLLHRLAPQLTASDGRKRQRLLAEVEQAKLRVSATRERTAVDLDGTRTHLDTDLVGGVAQWLWTTVLPDYEQVARQLLSQLRNNKLADTYAPLLAERKVTDWTHVSRLFDKVFTAGGTSLLPHFDREMKRAISLPEATPVIGVGGAYPVAAAVGALAHAINPRMTVANDEEAEFTRSLEFDIVLDSKDGDGSPSNPREIVVVDRASGSRLNWEATAVQLPSSWRPGETVQSRLLPSGEEGFKKGDRFWTRVPFQRLDVTRAPAQCTVSYDPEERAVQLASDDVLDMYKMGASFKEIGGAATQARRARPSEANSQLPAAEDVVVDFGMSKTVVAWAPKPRTLRASEFEHVDVEFPIVTGFGLSQSTEPATPPASPPADHNIPNDPAHASLIGSKPGPQVGGGRPLSGPATLVEQRGVTTGTARRSPESPFDAIAPMAAGGLDIAPSAMLDTGDSNRLVEDAVSAPDRPQCPDESVEKPAPEELRESPSEKPKADSGPSIDERSGNNEEKVTEPPPPRSWQQRVSAVEPQLPTDAATRIADEWRHLVEIARYVDSAGLQIPMGDIVHLHLSCKVTPFVLLCGPPGVGKTALARNYAAALGMVEERGTFARIAVEATWTDPSRLLDIGHGTGEPSSFAQLAHRARSRSAEIFGVVLDECNLAHVDYYFSPVLSAMEDDGVLMIGGVPLAVPLRAPEHRLVIMGTMNVDDAGTSMTDKVLDRASVVELVPDALGDRLNIRSVPPQLPNALSAEAWRHLCELPPSLAVPPEVRDLWRLLASPETPEGSPAATEAEALAARPVMAVALGKRLAWQVCAYLYHAHRIAEASGGEYSVEKAMDRQVLCRILPRLRGDSRGEHLLSRLRQHAERQGWALTTARVLRMQRQLRHEHAFDFWTS